MGGAECGGIRIHCHSFSRSFWRYFYPHGLKKWSPLRCTARVSVESLGCVFSPRTPCPCASATYFVNLLYMLLSRQMINNDLAAMSNNQEFFSDSDPTKQPDQPCNFIPYWPQNALLLVVRGSVALWLGCPHLLLEDCLTQPFAIAWTHMLPWSKPQAHWYKK